MVQQDRERGYGKCFSSSDEITSLSWMVEVKTSLVDDLGWSQYNCRAATLRLSIGTQPCNSKILHEHLPTQVVSKTHFLKKKLIHAELNTKGHGMMEWEVKN